MFTETLFQTSLPAQNTHIPMVLNWGLGVESTAILVRWLTEPSSRNFPLEDLTILTAMVGSEFPSTIRKATELILPLILQNRVRLVQVARRGHFEQDGIAVLSSRQPQFLNQNLGYTLRTELHAAGTVPTWRPYSRRCSQKHKGYPCDSWLAMEFGVGPYRQALGFNAQELDRAERDTSYSRHGRQAEYPLIEWGWSRSDADAYLFQKFGVRFNKSHCTFCPFSNGKPEALLRYCDEPEAFHEAFELEFISLSLNPNMSLFPSGSLREAMEKVNRDLVTTALLRLYQLPWSLYRVKRLVRSANLVYRKTETLAGGTYQEMREELYRRAATQSVPLSFEADIPRLYLHRRSAGSPVEDMLVIAPAGVRNKARSSFDGLWLQAATPSLFSPPNECSAFETGA